MFLSEALAQMFSVSARIAVMEVFIAKAPVQCKLPMTRPRIANQSIFYFRELWRCGARGSRKSQL